MSEENIVTIYDRCFEKVMKHMKWSEDKTSLWFSSNNPLIGDCSPNIFIVRRPEKFEKWLDALIDENTNPHQKEGYKNE